MGKASSAKKVARAAKVGNSRQKQRKAISFPLAIGLIVVLGVSLVTYARTSGDISVDTEAAPQAGRDHWHAAYGIYLCDYFSAALNDKGADVNGIHTHGDSLVHIHPTATVSGRNATMGVFLDQVGVQVDEDRIELADGRTFEAGETTCDGEAATVQVAHWKDARTAPTADGPDDMIESDFDDIRFSEDLGAYTIAFVPEGAEIPPPPEAERICEDAIADSGGEAAGECSAAGTESAAPGDPTATTLPPEGSTETTVAPEGATETTEGTAETTPATDPASTTSAPPADPSTTTSSP